MPMDQKKRSTLFTLGAIGAAYAGLRYLPNLRGETLTLEAMESPRGFRRYVAGESTIANFDPFIGLDADNTPEKRAALQRADSRVAADLCTPLFSGTDQASNTVPMASFSDYYCPYCRIQTDRLSEMSKTADISVTWHELPLLGDNSVLAAKAALAAKRQDAYVAFHAHLMSTPFAPTFAYLTRLSNDLGVDEEQLRKDMQSPEVLRELEDTAAVSRVFGFFGTPALVIGRTVILGKVSDAMIEEIVAMEREEGWNSVCTTA